MFMALEFPNPGHYGECLGDMNKCRAVPSALTFLFPLSHVYATVVRLGGAGAGHVRLKSVEKVEGPETMEAGESSACFESILRSAQPINILSLTRTPRPPPDIDRHLFKKYAGLNMFMEGAAMPATRYGYHVHAEV